jgi:long-chain acyl-CoA synthetase
LLEESFRKYAGQPAFACMDKAITYGDLDRMSQQMAAWLQSRGLQPGARVAIMLPNVLQYPVAMAAALRGGYTIVNVNPLYTPRELQHQLVDSGAEALVVLENFAHTVQQVIANTQVRHVIVATMGDLLGGVKGAIVNLVVRKVKKMVPAWSLPGSVGFKKMLADGARYTFQPVELGHDDIAFLQYTGGTTGVSKGAVLLHRNVLANVLQNEAWFGPSLAGAPAGKQLEFMCALPLYHIYALTVCALLGMRVGAMNVLIPNPRDMDGFIKELGKYKINVFPAVNTLYNGLVNQPGFAKLDHSSYLVCPGGGMAVQQAVADKWLKITGTPIVEGYGLSETSPVVTANRCDITAFTGTIGLPLPSTEVLILDEANQPVPFGQSGEIAVRGPQVMAGYWKRDDETAKVMTASGFMKTGDIGIMDEKGYTRIVDRKKDMILVSGFNVYPNEVENVVASHPGVLEVACVGVPDKHSGEAVKLYVVKKDPALTTDALMDFCKEELTGYKRPRLIEFRDTLPKTNVGKILRRELRDEKQPA